MGVQKKTLHILVAEDSPTQAEKLKYILEAAGHQVTVAPNGRAALEAARAASHDLLISDVMMPEMDGAATLAKLRQNPCTANIPVLLMTARKLVDDMERFRSLGVLAVITKPFDPLALPVLVRDHLAALHHDEH